ncbi:MAG: cupin domain-containing protein [Saprospirales bacterium]|nr:MAG: cupin domain-containing protein [Saprospirales bacterium]
MEEKKIVLDMVKEGEKLTFYTEPDFNAPAVEFECVLAPGSKGPEPHIHTLQTETFHVVSGHMIGRLKGEEDVHLGPGEKFVAEPGKVHSFTNGSKEEPLVVNIVVEPALDFQWFLSVAARSAIRNGGSWKDASLLEIGHLMWLSRDQQRMGVLPFFLQDVLFFKLSMFARLFGKAKNISPKVR